MKFATKVIHKGINPDSSTGSIMTPIYQTSTFVQDAMGVHKGYEYARSANPTRSVLEENLAALENAKYGRAFASGMSAVETLMKTLNPGDEVISFVDLYGGSFRLFTQLLKKFGINFSFIDLSEIDQLPKLITKNTKWIWVETPTNPMLKLIDLEKVVTIAHQKGAKVAVDNTFASPYLQNPLDWGVDVVMHSVTKYIGGHSDVIMGFLCTNDKKLEDEIAFIQNTSGAIPSPNDCFLVLRGIKTLHIRMERHCENTRKIVQFLLKHDKVAEVFWPGIENHPHFAIAQKQMRDYGGMLSFSFKNDTIYSASHFIEKLQYFNFAESLGGVESIVGHPSSMTHASITKKHKEKIGIKDSLIRISVGIEDAEDLIDDLDQALA